MKPKAPTEHEDGLLEYLEDIIGTSKYKAPIEELGKTVETLSEERTVKLQRVQVVEKEKNGLEVKKKQTSNEFQKNLVSKPNHLFRARNLKQ